MKIGQLIVAGICVVLVLAFSVAVATYLISRQCDTQSPEKRMAHARETFDFEKRCSKMLDDAYAKLSKDKEGHISIESYFLQKEVPKSTINEIREKFERNGCLVTITELNGESVNLPPLSKIWRLVVQYGIPESRPDEAKSVSKKVIETIHKERGLVDSFGTVTGAGTGIVKKETGT